MEFIVTNIFVRYVLYIHNTALARYSHSLSVDVQKPSGGGTAVSSLQKWKQPYRFTLFNSRQAYIFIKQLLEWNIKTNIQYLHLGQDPACGQTFSTLIYIGLIANFWWEQKTSKAKYKQPADSTVLLPGVNKSDYSINWQSWPNYIIISVRPAALSLIISWILSCQMLSWHFVISVHTAYM